jgi:hypothetical protein
MGTPNPAAQAPSQIGDPADVIEVVVTVRLPISRSAWEINYGIGGTNAIRADVKEHTANAVFEHYRELGLLNEPEEN